MPKFFGTVQQGNQIILKGEDARHIRQVLRMHTGEPITVTMPDQYDYQCKISMINNQQVTADIMGKYPNDAEPHTCLTLYQALPKGDKMDFIIQKSIELGVSKIVPVRTARCISRPDEKAAKKKTERWNKIAKGAAEQSGRAIIPAVTEILDFPQAVRQLSAHGASILFYEGGGSQLADFVPENSTDIGIMVGPEGGFEQSEVTHAEHAGISAATLGKRILRCETAPVAAAAILMYLTKNI